METFIQKHQRLLKTYCIIAYILAWYLFGAGLVQLYLLISPRFATGPATSDFIFYAVLKFICDFLIPSILAFSTAVFIDYVLSPSPRVPMLLRITDKVCYAYAILIILNDIAAGRWLTNIKFFEIAGLAGSYRILLFQPFFGITLIKVLILIGIAVILQRILSVIEESKTLV